RAQLGDARGHEPGHAAAEAEADHAGSIRLREWLRFGVRQAALEVLHVARRRSIAQEAGDAVRVADLRGAALAREQIDGQPDVAGLRHAPRDAFDIWRQAAVP